MKKRFSFQPSPEVCSKNIDVEIDDDGKISYAHFTGGCPGSLPAVAALVIGKTPAEAAAIIGGIRCGNKSTSCPDQLAQMLQKIIEKHPEMQK